MMKESDFNLKTEELLNSFETFPNPSPSADWNTSLMQKIAHTKQNESSGITPGKVSLIAVLFILLNIGFFVRTLNNSGTTNTNRSTELQTISNELLIPSTNTTN